VTQEQANLKVVQDMFNAFDQGNIQAGLDIYSVNVDFQSPVTRTNPPEITWAKPRHSRGEVAEYFKELFEKVQPERLETIWFTAQDDRVVVEGKNRGTAKSTCRSYEHDWVMVFTVYEGKIVRFRHYYDTADIVAAFQS
jgi:ketosteroid isomerase-like protein